jgi:ariadne-1
MHFVSEEGMGNKISCAAHGESLFYYFTPQSLIRHFIPGCDIFVDDKTVMTLVTDSKVKMKYQHLITNSFVEVSLLFVHL